MPDFQLKEITLLKRKEDLSSLPKGKLLINCIYAYSYHVAQYDPKFADALRHADVLLPDGASIVKAIKWLTNEKIERISGADLFTYEMEALNKQGGVCFFLGSNAKVLELIRQRAIIDYPAIKITTYSPSFRTEFSTDENLSIIDSINAAAPNLLWIGMTAPKQEKWIHAHLDKLNIDGHIGAIGAVFDFYAGTVKRAPKWWQEHCLEWLYRLIQEPKRMWRRYLIGNISFIYHIFREKYNI